MHALITGSSGYIGSRLVAQLSAHGHQVTATGRSEQTLARFDFPDSVRRVSLDATDEESCDAAFAQVDPVDVAFYLVHSIGGDDYAERDLFSAQAFAAAAERAGVGRIVYLGGFVPDGQELSEHLESRADVGDALAASGVETVWLRAAVILGSGSTSFELIRYLAERLPVVPMPAWMQHVVAPIAVNDVLYYLEASMNPAMLPRGDYEISNGETLTYGDVIKRYAELAGRRRLWLNMHGVTPSVAAPIVSLLTPIPRNLVADLVLSLGNSMNSDDRSIRHLVPDPPAGLTSLDSAIRRAEVRDDFVAHGVCATFDPLQLTETDPQWAGGDAYRARIRPARATDLVLAPVRKLVAALASI